MKNALRLSLQERFKLSLLSVSDRIDAFCSMRGALTPPKPLIFQYGGGSYYEIGLEFFRYFLDFGNVTRDADVLEIGCGVGRMAMPWLAYLNERGSYDGFDIMPEGVSWCRSAITSRRNNFRFHLATELRNDYYNPKGTVDAADYRFDFLDGHFDFVYSTSVFTHLQPKVIARYLLEARRVLRPGGKCLHTFFLLDPESLRRIGTGSAHLPFHHQFDGFLSTHPRAPEAAIALPLEAVHLLYQAAGLQVDAVHPGAWSGRPDALAGQDIVVATRPL